MKRILNYLEIEQLLSRRSVYAKSILLEKSELFPRENYTFPLACVTGVRRIERRVNDNCGATSLFAKQGLPRPLTNRFWQCSTPIGL